MVMMAFLHCADFGFEPQNLSAVLTQDTDRRWYGAKGGMPGPLCRADSPDLAVFHCQNLRTIAANPAIGRRHIA